MKNLNINEVSPLLLSGLQHGAFLTVKDKFDNLNTMAIAWGSIGYMWRKPVFTVMVRKSRHTFDLIEHSNNFTVSFDIHKKLKNELSYCGTYSGKDVDKFKELNLSTSKSVKVHSPIIKECSAFIECKIIYRQALVNEGMHETVRGIYGMENDLHTLYYGEIVACYSS